MSEVSDATAYSQGSLDDRRILLSPEAEAAPHSDDGEQERIRHEYRGLHRLEL
jgi:hypothetical protein